MEVYEDVKSNYNPLTVITGDFNTLCHGLARLAPSVTPTFKQLQSTFGYSEASWFQKNIIEKANKELSLNFQDPFDKEKDITLSSMKGIIL